MGMIRRRGLKRDENDSLPVVMFLILCHCERLSRREIMMKYCGSGKLESLLGKGKSSRRQPRCGKLPFLSFRPSASAKLIYCILQEVISQGSCLNTNVLHLQRRN